MLQQNVKLPLFVRQSKDRSTLTSEGTTRRERQSDRPIIERRSELDEEKKPTEIPQTTTASEQSQVRSQTEKNQSKDSDLNCSNLTGDSASKERSIGSNNAESSTSVDAIASNSSEPFSTPPSLMHQPAAVIDEPVAAQRLQSQYLESQRLRQVERKLRSSLDLATVLGATVVETAAFFQARQVSLLSYDPVLLRWQSVAQYCENQALAWQKPFAFPLDDFPTLIDRLQQGYPVCLGTGADTCFDADSDGADSNIDTSRLDVSAIGLVAEAQRWRSQWSGNWLLIPVQRRKTIEYALNETALADSRAGLSSQAHWGIMALAISEQQAWSSAAVALGQSIAVELEWAIAQASQHQELLQANQELQKLALSDGLTRLANRRRFDEHLSDEWQRLARDRQPLSLILCDLDHFKRYNDTFGHPAGDRCLIRVARALLNAPQRPADLVARYGGEEFAVILPNTDTHGAWRIAQKIHKNIRALKIEHAPDNEEKYVTVTMGVSTVLPGHKSTAQMLIQASDLALYHAKQQGRNRTYIHAHYNTVEDDFERSGESLDMTPPE